MLCLSGFDLYFRWVPLLNGGDRLIEVEITVYQGE